MFAEPPSRRATRTRGLISATRGNHGQSLAWAGSRFGLPVTIVVPFGNSAEKNAAMAALGATLIEHGADFEEAAKKPIGSPRPRTWYSFRPSRRIW